jgi:alkylated DNA nucleotide flippase Atl1
MQMQSTLLCGLINNRHETVVAKQSTIPARKIYTYEEIECNVGVKARAIGAILVVVHGRRSDFERSRRQFVACHKPGR